MNKSEREQLSKAIAELGIVKGTIEAAVAVLDELASAEQEKYDNLSEGLQQSERGQAFEANATALSDAKDKLDEALSSIEDAEGVEDNLG